MPLMQLHGKKKVGYIQELNVQDVCIKHYRHLGLLLVVLHMIKSNVVEGKLDMKIG